MATALNRRVLHGDIRTSEGGAPAPPRPRESRDGVRRIRIRSIHRGCAGAQPSEQSVTMSAPRWALPTQVHGSGEDADPPNSRSMASHDSGGAASGLPGSTPVRLWRSRSTPAFLMVISAHRRAVLPHRRACGRAATVYVVFAYEPFTAAVQEHSPPNEAEWCPNLGSNKGGAPAPPRERKNLALTSFASEYRSQLAAAQERGPPRACVCTLAPSVMNGLHPC